jgi:hypothetical protein
MSGLGAPGPQPGRLYEVESMTFLRKTVHSWTKLSRAGGRLVHFCTASDRLDF